MAKNLRARIPATDTLVVHDLNPAATEKFVQEVGIAAATAGATPKGTGIEIAENPREVAEKSDTIITVLPEASHVKNVFRHILNPQLPDSPSAEERLFIDCSTIDPSSSREVHNAVRATSQGRFVDAPMSGGVVGARAATLTFMLGSNPNLIDRVTPILSMMGKKTLYCGRQGAGLAAKLSNNYLLAISNIATAEAMNLGLKWGLEPKVLSGVINASSGRCWSSEINNPVGGVVEGTPSSDDYAGGFSVGLMKKDLGLAIEAAEEVGAQLQLSEKAQEVYTAMEEDDKFKGRDFSVVYRYLGGDS
ncbi:MAG: hypothetical protein M4579_004934 [Chaenotheca gracillima]|nr:MAG: hypothetical protein M4579_004934 [Chaenotheca gracillima]